MAKNSSDGLIFEKICTVAKCHGDPLFSKWGPDGDPIFSEMGTKWGPSPAKMGTLKTHVCKIDRIKLIRWNKASKRGENRSVNRTDFTDKLAWNSLMVLVVLSQVIKLLTLNRGCFYFSWVLQPEIKEMGTLT